MKFIHAPPNSLVVVDLEFLEDRLDYSLHF